MKNIENFLKSIEEYIFNHRRTIVWLGITIIIIMAIFPPWVIEGLRQGGASFRINEGYSFILYPPNDGFMVHVDLGRFAMQCIPIVIIICLVLLLEKRHFYPGEINGERLMKEYEGSSDTKKYKIPTTASDKDIDSRKSSKELKGNIKKCPQCGLLNPPFSSMCECGYNFKKQQITKS